MNISKTKQQGRYGSAWTYSCG